MTHALYNDAWPQVQIDVDDFRDAREDEVEHCEYCVSPFFEDELEQHLGEKRCKECRFVCPVCRDADVYDEGEFCLMCAYWALGCEA